MRRRKRDQHLISLLVPMGGEDRFRHADWSWLERYYRDHLGCEAEIIVGRDRRSDKRWYRRPLPFSKTTAINDAFRRSHGDIIVLLDTDCYIDTKVITHCADRIRAAHKRHVRLWFVPYREIYRLTAKATREVLASEPWHPLRFSTPPPREDYEDNQGSGPSTGHRYGAMIMIMPREAFECVGGMDPRFRGWGGDDVSFLHALDALWSWPNGHKNTPNDVLHLWHPKHDSPWGDDRSPWRIRMWVNQIEAGINDWLAMCYASAAKSPKSMRKLVDDGLGKKRK